MSMLAERRNRKRYNLVPRGKALYEDGNRFGTRMLEKMGWSKGKGLGAKENGDKEFVRIRYKHDNEGLGFEDRDDQWTQHESEFNGLLQALGGASGSENNSQDAVDEAVTPTTFGFGFQAEPKREPGKVTISESLEEKSKKSKARVHYQKFTRGKDISRYSEKELANIFGKKSFDKPEFPQIMSNPPSQDASDSAETIKDTLQFGVATISTGTSIADYFKSKMEKMCNKLKGGGKEYQTSEQQEPVCNGLDAISLEEPINQKLEKKKKKQSSDVELELSPTTAKAGVIQECASEGNKSKNRKREEEKIGNSQDIEELQPKEKRKKSKKNKANADFTLNQDLNDEVVATESFESEIIPQIDDLSAIRNPGNIEESNSTSVDHRGAETKSKRKSQTAEMKQESVEPNAERIKIDKREKSSKRNYKSEILQEICEPCANSFDAAESKPKKSKRKSPIEELNQEIIGSNHKDVDSKKREKKPKYETSELVEEIEEPSTDSHNAETTPKNSKRKTSEEIVESNADNSEAEIKSKKPKRKSKPLQNCEAIKTEIEFPIKENSQKQTESSSLVNNPPFSKPPRNHDRGPRSLRDVIAKAKFSEGTETKQYENLTDIQFDALESNEGETKNKKSKQTDKDNANTILFEQSSPSLSDHEAENNLQVQNSTPPHSSPASNQIRFPELIKKKSKKKNLIKSTLDTSTNAEENEEEARTTDSQDVDDPNVFCVSSYKAELFYNVNADGFMGSNFSKVIGYGLTSDVKLSIKEWDTDSFKIRRLYGKVFDKYAIHREGNNPVRYRPKSIKELKKCSRFSLQV